MPIIGISGKMGSGKNTVASIIQCLDSDFSQEEIKSIITGDSEHEKEKLKRASSLSFWVQKSFAKKVKQIASIITGIPELLFDSQEFKKTPIGEMWDTYPQEGVTARRFLQKLGTDAIRDAVHKDAWVNALMVDYVPTKTKKFNIYSSYWIITDVRFDNEFEAIKERGGIIIRVNRESSNNSNHESENELDNHTFDYTIDNNKDIDYLIEEVKKIQFSHSFN